MKTKRLSANGRIILPKNIDGIQLRPAGRFPETMIDEVAGSLRFKRKSKTTAQMRAATRREVMRRHDLGRY